ncbi:MAG TPA: GGDEF domain-containing protein [Gemmatimonadales bacterium]|nr:GGDEF domain-containing protein [Gemmatimonadales bacterium]
MRRSVQHLAGLGAGGALMLVIYLANELTPPDVKLGLLYLVPVLLITWYEGIWMGAVFIVAAMALRMAVELEQQPGISVGISLLNQMSFAVVAGVAMLAYRRLRRSQEELARLATQDQLTNVLNARAFADRLTQELERNRRYPRPLALLYLDLDNFKVINDSHGHQTGDAVLRLVADAMRSSVRQADVVGRLGGDEFAVLMPETDAQLADAAAKRLAAGLRNVFKGTPSVTASIGVVSCTATDANTDDLLRRADQAMYDAKRLGKDRVVQVAI